MPRGKSPLALDLPRPTSWLDKAGVSKQDGAYEALRSAIVPVQRMGPTIDASVLASLATACRDQKR